MKIIIYLPALNEGEGIAKVISRLPRELPGIDEIETLVVDDGSTDQTTVVAKNAGAEIVSHGKNRGVGAAFRSAIQYSLENGADILIGIDADGQFDPSEIPTLLQPLFDDKADMVIGNRFVEGRPESMPGIRFWGNQKMTNLVNSFTGRKFHDVSCGFRAYNHEALLHLNLFSNFTYTHESILSLVYQGLRVAERSIHVKYDPERKSRVAKSILNYAVQTSKTVLKMVLDYRPMRVFGTIGAIFIIIGMGFELFLMGFYVFIGSFSPYKSFGFIGLGLILFGMLILILALIANMMNRIRMNQDIVLYEIKKLRYHK